MRGSGRSSIGVGAMTLAVCIAAGASVVSSRSAAAATSGHTITSPSSVRFHVEDAPWADLHYQVNGGGQLNIRMNASGNNHTYDVTGVPSGATVRYFFTIGSFTGGAVNTAWTQFSMSGGGGGGGQWAVVWEDEFDGSGQPGFRELELQRRQRPQPRPRRFRRLGQRRVGVVPPRERTPSRRQPGDARQLAHDAQHGQRPQLVPDVVPHDDGREEVLPYGRIEARMALPTATGSWPAFWMLGDACDETFTSAYTRRIDHYDRWPPTGPVAARSTSWNTERETRPSRTSSGISASACSPGPRRQRPTTGATRRQQRRGQFHVYAIEWGRADPLVHRPRDNQPGAHSTSRPPTWRSSTGRSTSSSTSR